MKTDKEEFLKILANYQGILHKVNLIYFRNIADREDNFQEISYQLYKSYPSLKNKKSIGSWIYKVAINTSISKLKKDTAIKYDDTIPEIISADNIEFDITMNEETKQLIEAIHGLNELDKAIMLLYLEERSYEEIAEITGISKSNVGVRINRAKDILKKRLKHLSYGKE
jgi:RNA polymerase sigma-70 factor (ECF subfamily)